MTKINTVSNSIFLPMSSFSKKGDKDKISNFSIKAENLNVSILGTTKLANEGYICLQCKCGKPAFYLSKIGNFKRRTVSYCCGPYHRHLPVSMKAPLSFKSFEEISLYTAKKINDKAVNFLENGGHFTSKTSEEKLQFLHKKAAELGVTISEPVNTLGVDDCLRYTCNKHNQEHCSRIRDFVVKKQARCCYDESLKKNPGAELEVLLKAKNCSLVGERPKGTNEYFSYRCNLCKIIHRTMFVELRDSSNRAPCCIYNKGGPKTPLLPKRTRKKNSQQNHRHDPAYFRWMRAARKHWGKSCAVTGQKAELDTHHLYGQITFPTLKLEVTNSIVLSGILHRAFHSFIGREAKITPEALISYFVFLIENKEARDRVRVTPAQLSEVIPKIEKVQKLLKEQFPNLNLN